MDTTVSNRDYWKKTLCDAEDGLRRLFSESDIELSEAIGKDCMEDRSDAERALAFVMAHSECAEETARGVVGVCCWLQSFNEIGTPK